MRIISGEFKGRRFHPPAKGWPTRPTTDFAKEGLFNILANVFDFEQLRVLDLFGGTGSHSYEFISRGAVDVTYVDQFPGCVAFVHQQAGKLGISDRLHIVRADVFAFIEACRDRYDYIFAGPPYGMPRLDELPDLIFSRGLLRPGGWFVLEHNPRHGFAEHPRFLRERNYGKTLFSIFALPEAEPGDQGEEE